MLRTRGVMELGGRRERESLMMMTRRRSGSRRDRLRRVKVDG